jgi:signal transduction histidine kinase
MDTLLQDLLKYSRLSRAEMDRTEIDLEALLHEVTESLNREIHEKNAAIEVGRPLVRVFANVATLKQVLANLISNALKFTSPTRTPHVRIYTEEREGQVRIWIEDNGIGIAAEHQEKIFGLFERLHNVATYPGTGVGLAIVRKGMERMGGRVGLISKSGQGSRFWLDLPGLSRTPESPATESRAASAVASTT